MPEWQIIIDSDDFPEPTPEEPPRHPRLHPRWLVVIGVGVALVLATILSLYRQRDDNRSQLKQDLTAAIFEEETVRHFGDPEQAINLIAPNVPEQWRQAYTDTFNKSSPPPDSIEITDIQFGGVCAIIDVKLDNDEKTRVYCLDNQQWKRASITPGVWGREETTLDLDNGVTLRFFPRDQKFAENLARDLNRFFETLSQWNIQINSRQLPEEIFIQPLELSPPLITSDNQQIVLNSPLVTQTTALPGSIAVRLALAQVVLSRILPVPPEDTQDLPGAPRLLTAAYTSLGAHMLLTDEERQDFAQVRQQHVGDEWISPFFADLILPDESQKSEAPAAAAYLLTEYIVSQKGPKALVTLIQHLPKSNSWDGIFESIVGRSTIELENDTALFFQYPPTFSNLGQEPINSPLPATLASHTTQGATVTLPHQNKPVRVEFPPEQTVLTSNGLSLPIACIPPNTELLLEGDWLEIQQRFAATEITLPHDIALFPAPQILANTTAYLKTDENLMALNEDGTLVSLVNLDPSLQMAPLPVTTGESPHFLFSLNLPLCDRVWFAHYQPNQGITNQWLSPPTPMTWAWRVDQHDLFFFKLEGDSGQTIYQAGNNQSLQPVSQTEIPVNFLGWNDEFQKLVFHSPWMGFTNLGLIEPDTGLVSDLQMYLNPIRTYALSPDGHWLIFLPETNSINTLPRQLRLFDVDTLKSTKFLEILSDEKIGPAAWSLYLDQPQIAILFAPLHGTDAMRLQRLAIAIPDQPGTLKTVVKVDHGEQLTSPVFCSDGSLLYQVETHNEYQLKRWTPNHTPQTLLTLDQPFQPMACS